MAPHIHKIYILTLGSAYKKQSCNYDFLFFRNNNNTKNSFKFISVRAGAFALRYNGVLNWYPSAFQTSLSLQAPPS